MVITDALSYPNRRDVPNICSLRIQFRSYTPASVPVLTPKPTNTGLNQVIDGNESTSHTAFNLEFPECLSLDSSHKMIINRWHASESGWVVCFLVPLPASLFASCETRAFKLDAQMHIMEALQMQGLRAETHKVTVSHLKKAKEMGITQDTEMQLA
ncbi:hypothetical protein SCHPADRAFT_220712 [Schizopora paradoxa]|uniref:Uncharacterized protein n=1 Tax=Schizopora paradoxa TaxID=27342 RepID=A0A0H2S3C3_9AGAM|nr:hypothetical protein SCHPADRAFT_220712 [Schizopora paradoxa]